MATGRNGKTKIVKQVRLKKNDVTFDPDGWMVIKNPAINRLIEQRWLVSGLIQPINLICPRPPDPPPSPDGMCACAYITLKQEVSQVRTDQPRPGELRPGELRAGRLRFKRSGTIEARGVSRTPRP